MTGLLGSTVLEVALGVACVYLLLGLFCTAVNEWIASLFRMRSKLLYQGLKRLLGAGEEGWGPNPMVGEFFKHPLIRATMDQRPSYLPARTFAQVVLDIAWANKPPGGSISYFDLENEIRNMPSSGLRITLLSLLQDAGNSMEGAQRAIERWYDDAMDRVTGRYKRKTQFWTLILATMVTVAINADTLRISRRLWIAPSLRSQMVEAARNRSTAPPSNVSVNYPNPDEPVNPQVTPTGADTGSDLSPGALAPILGWEGVSVGNNLLSWMERILGWLLTIAAVSISAPFWFDVLSRFMSFRHAGPPPAQNAETRETPVIKSMIP